MTGRRIQVKRYNDEGELISWTLYAPRIATLTNLENGTLATGHQALNAVFDPASPNVPSPLSISGLRFILTAPQFGVVLLDAGRVEFGEGGIEFTAGKHQLVLGDLDAFCAYFASP